MLQEGTGQIGIGSPFQSPQLRNKQDSKAFAGRRQLQPIATVQEAGMSVLASENRAVQLS
jgi:hypothetical protein